MDGRGPAGDRRACGGPGRGEGESGGMRNIGSGIGLADRTAERFAPVENACFFRYLCC